MVCTYVLWWPHLCPPSLITLCHAATHCEPESETRHIPPPPPPPPPAVSQLSAFRSPSRSPQRSRQHRLTRMRIRERLCPNLLLRPRPWPPSDTDLCWSLPDTLMCTAHISPAPSQTTGCPCFRPPPSYHHRHPLSGFS